MTEVWVAVIGSSVLTAFVAALFQRKRTEAEAREINARAAAIERSVADERERLDHLRFVLSHMLTNHEQYFLKVIAGLESGEFSDNYRDREHIRRVLDLGFAEKTGKNVAELEKGDDLTREYRATPAGRRYLELLQSTSTALAPQSA